MEAEADFVSDAYEPVAASTLAFDLPNDDTYREPLDLSREGRERSAFLGYDEGVAEYYALRWEDRQSDNSFRDRYERRAVSTKVGVRYR